MIKTKEEFIQQYCQRSNVTSEFLLSFREAIPCSCEDSLCEGWQMVEKEGRQSTVGKNTGTTIDMARSL